MFMNLNISSFNKRLRKNVFNLKSEVQDLAYLNSLVNGNVKSSLPSFSKMWSDILNT